MDFVFYGAGGINGFDQYGHYLRARLVLTTCQTYVQVNQLGCTANFNKDLGATTSPPASGLPASTASASRPRPWRRHLRGVEGGRAAVRRPRPRRTRSSCRRPCFPAMTACSAVPAPRREPPRQSALRISAPSNPSSTISWANEEAQRSRIHRSEPRADRRGDDARRDRRRLPRLQRELGPAVRPHLRRQRRGAQRGRPRARQRGPHRRHADRPRLGDHTADAGERCRDGIAEAEAREEGRARSRRTPPS